MEPQPIPLSEYVMARRGNRAGIGRGVHSILLNAQTRDYKRIKLRLKKEDDMDRGIAWTEIYERNGRSSSITRRGSERERNMAFIRFKKRSDGVKFVWQA